MTQLAWGPHRGIDAGDERQGSTEVAPHVPCQHLRTDGGREYQSVLLPPIPRAEPVSELLRSLLLQGVNAPGRQGEGPPRPSGLGVAIGSDRPPDFDVRWRSV